VYLNTPDKGKTTGLFIVLLTFDEISLAIEYVVEVKDKSIF